MYGCARLRPTSVCGPIDSRFDATAQEPAIHRTGKRIVVKSWFEALKTKAGK